MRFLMGMCQEGEIHDMIGSDGLNQSFQREVGVYWRPEDDERARHREAAAWHPRNEQHVTRSIKAPH